MKQKKPSGALSHLIVTAIIFGLAGLLTVIGLINNSSEAKRRYEVLTAADAAGGEVETALNDLRQFMYAHMNTQIGSSTGVYPPIQLRGTYDRLVESQQAEAKKNNAGLYQEATAYCEARFPAGQLANGRVQCVSEYISERGVTIAPIPDAQYKFDFVSPRWSADLAGISLLFFFAGGVVLVAQTFLYLAHRSHIKLIR